MSGARRPGAAAVPLILIAALLAAALAGPATRASAAVRARFRAAIVGGTAAGPGTFPWLAYVDYSADGDAFACTGTVISPVLVLTAGHCGVDLGSGAPDQADGYAVVTGALDWTSPAARTSGVSRVLVDPAYDPSNGQDDAALLVLSTPTTAPALALATASDVGLLAPGSLTTVAGWGETVPGDLDSAPDVLQYATTVVQSGPYCNHDDLGFDPGSELCAVDAPVLGSGTCFGDSGGPLIANELQDQTGQPTEIGVTSRVTGQCATSRPDIFTRADAISGWADDWIAQEAAHPPATSGAAPPTPAKPLQARMTAAQAQHDAEETAARVLRARFDPRSYTARCTRVSAIRFACVPRWTRGGEDYSGHEAVFDQAHEAGVVWRDRYAISWVSERCARRVAAAGRCRAHTVRGTY